MGIESNNYSLRAEQLGVPISIFMQKDGSNNSVVILLKAINFWQTSLLASRITLFSTRINQHLKIVVILNVDHSHYENRHFKHIIYCTSNKIIMYNRKAIKRNTNDVEFFGN